MADEHDQIELNSPQRGTKDGYLQLFFLSRQQLGRIIETSTSTTDPRVLMFTRHMVASITDDELRQMAHDKLEEGLAKIEDDGGSNEQKGAKVFNLCMEINGHITAFYDQFLGVTHRLKAGTV